VRRQTHVTCLAVEEVVPPPDPTDAAAVAMELHLVLIIEKFALVAEVLKGGGGGGASQLGYNQQPGLIKTYFSKDRLALFALLFHPLFVPAV
jgi:hypothetical protein